MPFDAESYGGKGGRPESIRDIHVRCLSNSAEMSLTAAGFAVNQAQAALAQCFDIACDSKPPSVSYCDMFGRVEGTQHLRLHNPVGVMMAREKLEAAAEKVQRILGFRSVSGHVKRDITDLNDGGVPCPYGYFEISFG